MENMNIADIIKSSFEGKPKGVEDAFNDVMQQKMADAIETRRQEIAQSMGMETDDADATEDTGETDNEDV